MAGWFHVNGIPVFAKSKADAVKAWRDGTLIRVHDPTLTARVRHEAGLPLSRKQIQLLKENR